MHIWSFSAGDEKCRHLLSLENKTTNHQPRIPFLLFSFNIAVPDCVRLSAINPNTVLLTIRLFGERCS